MFHSLCPVSRWAERIRKVSGRSTRADQTITVIAHKIILYGIARKEKNDAQKSYQ